MRNELQNLHTQIVIRTGYTGTIGEEGLVLSYEVNHYQEKNELTVQRLRSILTTAIRASRNIAQVTQSLQEKVQEIENLKRAVAQISVQASKPEIYPSAKQELMLLPKALRKNNLFVLPPASEKPSFWDFGLTARLFQSKVAKSSRKVIAVFDYSIGAYVYLSDNSKDILGFGWEELSGFEHGLKPFCPDMAKVDKIQKQLLHSLGTVDNLTAQNFMLILDYRLSLDEFKKSIRIMEHVSPLLFNDKNELLLSLHLFSNINHLKRSDGNTLLALHIDEKHDYYSISDYRSDAVVFGQREQEIILALDKNLPAKELSSLLNISSYTVDTHLRNLRDKFGAVSSNALLSYCKEIAHFI